MNLPTRIADFDATLKLAGIPIAGISGTGPNCGIDFLPEATTEQRALARQMAQSFDWRERTPEEKAAASAQASLTSSSPLERAVRETARALYESIVEVRLELNRRANGEAPRLLAIRTWDEAINLVRSRIGAQKTNAT